MKNIRTLVNIGKKKGNLVTLLNHLVKSQAAFLASTPVDDNFHTITPLIRRG
jgi:hypothetical protein